MLKCRATKVGGVGTTGAWTMGADYHYYIDPGLASGLARLVGVGGSVSEIGAGKGCYSWELRKAGIDIHAYDGVPNVFSLTGGMVRNANICNASSGMHLAKSDWTFCMEVLEHIPATCESSALDLLDATNTKGIVLTWAPPGSVGVGHINERSKEYVTNLLRGRAYYLDDEASKELVASCVENSHFPRSLAVWRRSPNSVRRPTTPEYI